MVPTPSPEEPLDRSAQALLLDIARASIRHGLAEGTPVPVDLDPLPGAVAARGAAFVTLRIRGNLRGCTGRLEADGPLAKAVAAQAFSAAFLDSRFPPVTEPETAELEVSISVLTEPEPLQFIDEEDLLRQLEPGRDGLVLEAGGRRGTFLPSVWEELPGPRDFLRELKRKAGLYGRLRSAKASRYRAFSFP
jgi:AmmeMemoRadiSam system protein A